MDKKEIIIYGIVGISSLTLLAYTVHMFIGGLVSERTENIVMFIVVIIGAIVLGFLARDIVRRRRLHALYLQSLQRQEQSQEKKDS